MKLLKNKLHIAILALAAIVLVQGIFLIKNRIGKSNQKPVINLMPISHEKDSVDLEQLKNELTKLDMVLQSVNKNLLGRNVKNSSISNLAKDSLSNAVYVNKMAALYSKQLVEMEEKLQCYPLGLPTSDGYVSSEFGNRVNPIPTPKAKVENGKVDVAVAAPQAPVKPDVSLTKKVKYIDSTKNPPVITYKERPLTEAEIKAKREKYLEWEKAMKEYEAQQKAAMASKKAGPNKSTATKGTVKPTNAKVEEGDEEDQMQFHKGIDIAIAFGSPVKCTAAGTVLFAGQKSGYGTCVIVSHGNGLATLYAHLSKLLVKPNQSVTVGQEIAKSGNSGRSTGPHLHYEVHKNNTPVNPKLFLNL